MEEDVMLALKITLWIFAGIFALCIIALGIEYKYTKRQVMKNDMLKIEGKMKLLWVIRKSHPFMYISSWLTDFGVVFLIVSIILKIVSLI